MEKAPCACAIPTKPTEAFTADPLKGLWHKHWFQASFLGGNLWNETEKNSEMLIRKHLRAKHDSEDWTGVQITEEPAGELAHALALGAFSYRSGSGARKRSRLTGEWIVFAKTNNRNICLTLAVHAETNEAVFARCLLALREFPQNSHPWPPSPRRVIKLVRASRRLCPPTPASASGSSGQPWRSSRFRPPRLHPALMLARGD